MLALITILTVLSLQTINEGIDLVRSERVALVEHMASEIDGIVEHLRTEIAYTASALGRRWQDDLTDSQKKELASLRSHLQQDLTTFYQIEQNMFVAVLDASGKILWTEPYLAGRMNQYLDNAALSLEVLEKGHVYIEEGKAILNQESPTLSLVVPIEDEREMVRGALIVDMPAFTHNIESGLTQRWTTLYDWELLTSSGHILAASVPGYSVGVSNHWEDIRHSVKEGQSDIVEHSSNDDTEDHLVAFATMVETSWIVTIEQPKQNVFELPWVMGRRLLILSGVAALIAIGLTWIFTLRIVRPLKRLAATAQSFGQGNLEVSIPAMGHDEIGQLAESLDTMRSQLKSSLDEIKQWNQELESRVKQRTKELEELYNKLRQRDKERGDLLGKIITAQEEERRRIARELHDEVSQTLTGLVMSLGSAETLLTPDSAVKQRIASLRGLASDAVEEVRRLIRNLRPTLLDDLGLVDAISWYVENHLAPAGVKVKLEMQGFDRRLSPTIEITLFRVIQEAITNIVKHSQAKTARVHLQLDDSAITGTIEDDGVGFDVRILRSERLDGTAVGLLGMEERINLLGGELRIESQPMEGTRVHFGIPWKEGDIGEDSYNNS